MTRVLVAGVPRSGTTWVGRVLAAALDAETVDEPDNHFVAPYAFRVKRRLRQGDYPQLRPGQRAPEYERLWRSAFSLGPVRPNGVAARARRRVAKQLLRRQRAAHISRTLSGEDRPGPSLRAAELLAMPERPRRGARAIVVKSVYSPLAVEWVADVCSPHVVIVLRNPLNVVSSWLELGWLEEDMLETLARPLRDELAERFGVPLPEDGSSTVQRAAWLAGALTSVLAEVEAEPPARTVATHEGLCRTSQEGFREIVESLGLDWHPAAERLLEEWNQPGRGFETTRIADGLEEVWRTRLTEDDASQARSVLMRFPSFAYGGPR